MAQAEQTVTQRGLIQAAVVPTAVSLIRQHSGSQQRVPRLSMAARLRLAAHDWSGGVAELDDCIQQALVLCCGEVIDADHLPLARNQARRAQATVLRTLRASDGVRDEAAKRLGIQPRTLRYQLAGMRAKGLTIPDTAPLITELSHE